MIRLGELYPQDAEAENWFFSLDDKIANQVAALSALRAFLISLSIATREPQFDLVHWSDTHDDIRLILFLVNKYQVPPPTILPSSPTALHQIADFEGEMTLSIQAKFATYCMQNAVSARREHWFEALKFCSLALAKLSVQSVDAKAAVEFAWSKVIEHAKNDAINIQNKQHVEFSFPLFSEDWLKDELYYHWKSAVGQFEDDPTKGTRFRYWREWYRNIAAGAPIDWEIQRRLASIEDHIWNNGPDAVELEIQQIRARRQVERAEIDLRNLSKAQTTTRHGIGGNNPPESIPDEYLASSISLIWEAENELSSALEEEKPDHERIEAILSKLKAGFAGLLKWLGRKADLAVDTTITATINTTIKAGGPAAVGVYLMAHPEKVQALINAVEDWLPLLR
ncbi:MULTISPECIES: hypothetical protein [unclassified Ruegeria]|uniref:hypothetical protein n=1 Tax=unclassified Ruegeria TaxID=2625375 RepID=UPI001ADBCBD6|nr:MULTISPECIES: hypothetical protein [unclassified Ruegeria]MBO9410125.1 hypothetical protein [Ruegeria sp. R8_1]MBO9414656.1 hypothetical protein [Ruegeria sp. R8_2]